jgi:DNA-binding transcriptional MerR regulator
VQKKRYSIQELSDLTGFSRRTIRYYIQEGLLDPPSGRGRGGFYYDSHINRLSKIKSLQDQGLKLDSIAELLIQPEILSAISAKVKEAEIPPSREVWIKLALTDGVEIHIRRDQEEKHRKKIDELIRFAKSILRTGETKNE